MEFQVLVEYDPETKSYAASVPGLPVYADADSESEALKLVREGLAWYFEDSAQKSGDMSTTTVRAKLVTVTI